jgi:hypothetical protein
MSCINDEGVIESYIGKHGENHEIMAAKPKCIFCLCDRIYENLLAPKVT